MSEVESRIDPVVMHRDYSRRNFLKTAAAAGAALTAAGIGGFGVATRYANAQEAAPYTTYQDLAPADILAFAYQLELLEGTFYDMGVNSGIFDGFALDQIAAIRDHEMAHADALAGAIPQAGGEVPATPEFTYPDGVFSDPAAFLQLAATFEPVGVGAYQGAAPILIGTEFLAPAVSIHNAEGQHVVAINILLGVDPPANMAFGEALPLPAVQEAVAPFGIG
jgi:hypothetical protein